MTPANTATAKTTTRPAATTATFGIVAADFATGASEVPAGVVALVIPLLDAAPVVAFLEAAASAFPMESPPLAAADTGIPGVTLAGAPHFVQNLLSDRGEPHFVQNRGAAAGAAASFCNAPHLVQNASHSVSAAPHWLQVIAITPPVTNAWQVQPDILGLANRRFGGPHFLILAISKCLFSTVPFV
ncbi:MAG: hypothetical protein ACRD4S_08925 [Candidatus Acidiferrales bacterium]